MTFKHAKFEDSVIMRSLERVAREKGMIKEEPLQKTASTHLDLSPTDSLMENILTLCAGLRQSGLNKYADELETNYLSYKRATNELYQTDPNAGEKEIETAHPKGSHKLEGVAGDDLAVVEDILDRHLKMLDVVNKKPTGKLASSSEVLSAVKKALGQAVAPTAPVVPEVLGDPDALVESAIAKLNSSINTIASQSDIGRGVNYMKSYVKDIKTLSRDLNVKNIMEMRRIAGKILDYASTGNHGVFRRYFESWYNWMGASISDKYDAVQEGVGNLFGGGFEMEPGALKGALDGISDAIKTFGKAIRALSEPAKATTAPAPAPVVNKILSEIKAAQMALAGIGGLINAERRKADPVEVAEADKWFKGTTEDLSNLEKNYANMSPEDAHAILQKITVDFPAVKKDWS